MALATSFYEGLIADNTLKSSGKPETTTYRFPIITYADDGSNVASTEALLASLATAINGIIIGKHLKTTIILASDIVGAGPASSALAQRENKWLCRYHGTTLNQNFQISIGTADLTKLVNNSEFLVLTSGVGAAFKTAFEAVVRSPNDDAETVVLDSVQFVGRNN